MIIYMDEFYNSFSKNNQKLNMTYVMDTIYYLSIKNKKFFTHKHICLIIFFIKNKCKFNIINTFINNHFKFIDKSFSKLINYIIIHKWNKIIYISIENSVEKQILEYFCELYNIYLDSETCEKNKLINLQAKHILGIHIKNMNQLKKYLSLNLQNTVYYIDIIFSKINKIYISFDYIFDND